MNLVEQYINDNFSAELETTDVMPALKAKAVKFPTGEQVIVYQDIQYPARIIESLKTGDCDIERRYDRMSNGAWLLAFNKN